MRWQVGLRFFDPYLYLSPDWDEGPEEAISDVGRWTDRSDENVSSAHIRASARRPSLHAQYTSHSLTDWVRKIEHEAVEGT